MAHQHGPHECYCPVCDFTETVEENVKCNTLSCPHDGTQMRAVETGEYRISQGEGGSIALKIIAATIIVGGLILIVKPKTTKV